jgi:hypothetical protein
MVTPAPNLSPCLTLLRPEKQNAQEHKCNIVVAEFREKKDRE